MKYNILTFILAFLLSGCSIMEDYGDHCPGQGEDEAGFVTLSFKLISSSIGQSRNDASHEETGSEWPAFEDLIKAEDFAFFIFCEQDDQSWPLVLKMTDIKTSTDPNMMITGAPGTYTVTAVISKDQLGHSITPGGTELVNFRIVVLANAGPDHNYDELDTTSYSALIEAASKWIIDIASIYRTEVNSTSVRDLYYGGIPMYGVRSFSISENRLYESRPEDRIWIGNINMLRSLAKIRVIDNIENRNVTTGLPRVEDINITMSNPYAYQLPVNAADYKDNCQVETPNIPVPPTGTDPVSVTLGSFTDRYIRFGYFPEQMILDNNPKVRMTITFALDADGKPSEQRTYEIPLTRYNGQSFNFGQAILRNHIYTLSVIRADYAEAEIKVEVEDWNPLELTLDYTETVTISPKLSWSDYQSYDRVTGEVEVKPWNLNDFEPLNASFGIATPVGATWTARLIGITGQGEFVFWEDEEIKTSVSGTIDGSGETVDISIITTDRTPEGEPKRALLQVTVNLPNGTVLEANMTPDGSEYTNFTIVQNPL